MSDQVWGYVACDGPSWLRRSVLQVRREVQKSDPSTQIRRVELFWNEDPRRTLVPMTDHFTYDGPSYLPSRGMKRVAEEIAQV